MGWTNPRWQWQQLRQLLDGTEPNDTKPAASPRAETSPQASPATPVHTPALLRSEAAVPYAELHCHSNFSFLDGASHPETLVTHAHELGLSALALTDHDGFYGVPRFAEAAARVDMATIFGAELTIDQERQRSDQPDPTGDHLVVLARNPAGYHQLSRALSKAHERGGEKGRPRYVLGELSQLAKDDWLLLTGCRKGAVRRALTTVGPAMAGRELDRLIALFGPGNVAVELTHHGDPRDDETLDALAALAARYGVPTLATNNVHYATPDGFRLATAVAAVRARRSLDEMEGWLPCAGSAFLRSGAEMAAQFARWPGAVERAAEFGEECAFSLQLVAPALPAFDVPAGHTPMSYLRELVLTGAQERCRSSKLREKAFQQIAHELGIIEEQGFAGYFLIVHHIVEFCRKNNILCQGRGSAANSAVCFALGITKVDSVKFDLLFERFLSPERDGYPDIDIDIESGRREEVIQFVYRHYGRDRAALVANVISYRPKLAVRDAAKAMGYSLGQQDAWSKQIDRGRRVADSADHDIPESVVELAEQLMKSPRHLGIHPGGMVLCDRPVIEVCPVEWGRMPHRTVLQWDKDDCAYAGLVKFDLLGLGMLSALRYALDFIHADYGDAEVDLATINLKEDAVYDMLSCGDSVGVFQVESRAQISTLPRLKPRSIQDLAIQVALIRPGPIQGGSVHPYLERRFNKKAIVYDHPALENSLSKTLGVPLFQEQLMQMAVDVAGFNPAKADQLRRAIGSKRSADRMAELKQSFYDGMKEKHNITGEVADTIFRKIEAFANFGFPESHAISFAFLVYSSAWIKYHYPAAFYAALLNAQPMGFYSPQSLLADARRHDVVCYGPHINISGAHTTLEEIAELGKHSHAIRLGLASVRTISTELAELIVTERAKNGQYASIVELASRVGLSTAQLEALATAGVFDAKYPQQTRRAALWTAGAAATTSPDRLPGVVTGADPPQLPLLTDAELAMADIWATGVSPSSYPTQFLRPMLTERGVIPVSELRVIGNETWVTVAGAITHRQRPSTAKGVTFLNLEDETGMLNVVCFAAFWRRHRVLARTARALLIRGKLERAGRVVSLRAEQLEPLNLFGVSASRDFR